METPPVASGRLLDVVRLDVRNATAAADDTHLLQQLLFLHGARRRINRSVDTTLRDRRRRQRDADQETTREHERRGSQGAGRELNARKKFRHLSFPSCAVISVAGSTVTLMSFHPEPVRC